MSNYILDKLTAGNFLDTEEISQVFIKMFAGDLSDQEVAGFLNGWRTQGETAELLLIGAEYLRRHAIKLPEVNGLRPIADNCGTGGSGISKFNISTAAAILAASCGVKVAKHGNRHFSGVCGSADLLFEAGLPDDLPYEKTLSLLSETGFCFFYAPQFHPVMKVVAPIRKSLGVRTVFNLLGPLANPISPDYQLLGVGDKKYLRPVAEALRDLRVNRGLVVHGRDGLDEVSSSAPTDGLFIESGKISEIMIDPATFKIKSNLSDIGGGDAAANLRILNRLFAGENVSVRNAVMLNAATLMWVAANAPSIEAGLKMCRESLDSGKTRRYFEEWLETANQ